jgi:hypothetical protein
MSSENRPDGELQMLTGKSRSGKTVQGIEEFKKEMARTGRGIVCDFQGTWPEDLRRAGITPIVIDDISPAKRIARLLKTIQQVGKGKAAIVYVGGTESYAVPFVEEGRKKVKTVKEFSTFCELVAAWVVMKECGVFVEELRALVAGVGRASGGWGSLTTGYLKYGVNITAIMQNPAETDTTTQAQARKVHICNMDEKARQYTAQWLNLPIDYLRSLTPFHDGKNDYLPYIDWFDGGQIVVGAKQFARRPESKITTESADMFAWLHRESKKEERDRQARYPI